MKPAYYLQEAKINDGEVINVLGLSVNGTFKLNVDTTAGFQAKKLIGC